MELVLEDKNKRTENQGRNSFCKWEFELWCFPKQTKGKQTKEGHEWWSQHPTYYFVDVGLTESQHSHTLMWAIVQLEKTHPIMPLHIILIAIRNQQKFIIISNPLFLVHDFTPQTCSFHDFSTLFEAGKTWLLGEKFTEALHSFLFSLSQKDQTLTTR